MIIRLEGEINEEMLDILIQGHNNCPPDEGIDLYFSSEGGSLPITRVIVDIINESDKIEVVKCYGELYSGGFFIPMFNTKPVEFLESSVGMVHKAWFPSVPLHDNLTLHKTSKEVFEKMSEGCQKLSEEVEQLKILNKEELKRFKNNEDVYLSVERLREMREIIWKPILKQYEEDVEQWRQSVSSQEETLEYLLEKQEEIASKIKQKLILNT